MNLNSPNSSLIRKAKKKWITKGWRNLLIITMPCFNIKVITTITTLANHNSQSFTQYSFDERRICFPLIINASMCLTFASEKLNLNPSDRKMVGLEFCSVVIKHTCKFLFSRELAWGEPSVKHHWKLVKLLLKHWHLI